MAYRLNESTESARGNVQAVVRPDGFPIWVRTLSPGSPRPHLRAGTRGRRLDLDNRTDNMLLLQAQEEAGQNREE
jgi:hypothetical protein